MKKLVIISHTEHQSDQHGVLKGWGPTVNEINYLANYWDEVIHVACLFEGEPKGSSMPYTRENIRFIAIPPFGGKTLKDKLGVLFKAPQIIRAINSALPGATHVQLRVPMGIGIYLIPWFAFRNVKKYIFWVKYANNWGEKKPPIGFGIQRWMLKKNLAKCRVTMNGFWPDQESHCISFENPCLNEHELEFGKELLKTKEFKAPFRLAFVGRIEEQKGAGRLMDALGSISPELIEKVVFIGEGPLLESCKTKKAHLRHNIEFTGSISQDQVHKHLQQSHFLVLPTLASEGFPKVLAEAACYGCIPVCTEIASVSHYVHSLENGIILSEAEVRNQLAEALIRTFNLPQKQLQEIAVRGTNMASKFTFAAYYQNLCEKIFR